MSEQIMGLTVQEAKERLAQEGFNELPSQRKQSAFSIFIGVIKDPMLFLLIAAGGVYLFLGEVEDALMLSAFVCVVVGITFYQERKTERALEALRDLSSPRASVVRDGVQYTVAGREVVRDDIVVLREGARVPADAVVVSSAHLYIDESLLTGESISVRKSEWDGKEKLGQPGGDGLPFVFSGTMVTQGHALVRVTRIGVNTEIGKIGVSLQSIVEEEMLLKKETRILVRNFAIVGMVMCAGVLVAYGIYYHDWIRGVLSGLSLSMALLPEEFSVVLVVFLAIGAWRMSRKRVLVRKSAAIETLGAATVLCVDKTGTLTLNEMRLASVVIDQEIMDLDVFDIKEMPEKYHALLKYSLLASHHDPFDPIEKEIHRVCNILSYGDVHLDDRWTLVREFPLSKELLALSHVWMLAGTNAHIVAAKGAPEAIIELCHMDHMHGEDVLKKVDAMSQKGLRVLGVAKATVDHSDRIQDQHDYAYEFVGLIGFVDPVRPSVAQAVQECYTAGIRVIMVTGDYPGTAQFVAQKIGLRNVGEHMTGQDLAQCDRATLQMRIRDVNIFTRVVPDQKLAIVEALKANGEIVVMTGDGVNDAPALKSAHIGVAMGRRGTDVAREASDIVLLDDHFLSIVEAVKMGRRIFDNLKKAISYIFSVHIPIAGISLIPVIFHLPVVLFPAHIAFLELIIDPACSVVYESEKAEKGIMKRNPRNLKKRLLDRSTFVISLLQGLGVLIAALVVYFLALHWHFSEEKIRTITFVTLVFGNLMLIVTNLAQYKNFMQILGNGNKALKYILISAAFFLLVILYTPFLRNIFHFSALKVNEILLSLCVAIVSIAWFEIYKRFMQKKVRISANDIDPS
ncbi:MAG: cation-translocating P-type ATPase [Parcubacteria group bacterium]